MRSSKRPVPALSTLLALLGVACATEVSVVPPLERPDVAVAWSGRVTFEGARDYLPTTVVESKSPATLGGTDFHYEIRVSNLDDEIPPWLALYSPVMLFGFPTGHDTVEAEGHLVVVRDGMVVKSYTATSTAAKARTIYTGSDRTSLRRQALVAVRRSIEAQMIQDKEELAARLDGSVQREGTNEPE